MPVFGFRCTECSAREDHILLAGEHAPTKCAACGGKLKRTWNARIQVNFEGWGFKKTDALLPENRPRKDWKALKERAQRIVDE